MTKVTKKKKKIRTKYDIVFVVMAVVAVLIIIGTGTYAYYQSTIAGTSNGTIAKWSFKANNQASTFDLDFGGLYPGKTDVKNIELSAEDSDLPVAFALIINYPNILNENMEVDNFGQMAEQYPLFETLYFDNSYTYGPSPGVSNTIGLFGFLASGEKMTIPLYYNWPYEREVNFDSITNDSDIKKYIADGRLLTDGITIIGRQLDISNMEGFESSLFAFLENLNSECSLGDYEYSNKFGYPCDWNIETTGGNLHVGSTFDLELADGTIIEFNKYLTSPIGFNF